MQKNPKKGYRIMHYIFFFKIKKWLVLGQRFRFSAIHRVYNGVAELGKANLILAMQ